MRETISYIFVWQLRKNSWANNIKLSCITIVAEPKNSPQLNFMVEITWQRALRAAHACKRSSFSSASKKCTTDVFGFSVNTFLLVNPFSHCRSQLKQTMKNLKNLCFLILQLLLSSITVDTVCQNKYVVSDHLFSMLTVISRMHISHL